MKIESSFYLCICIILLCIQNLSASARYNINHKQALLQISVGLPASERCNNDDKQALLKIKDGLTNTNLLDSWVPDEDCCDWDLVECDETTNRIISLIIQDDEGLTGQIPAPVGDVPFLQTLWFRNLPLLFGGIPEEISALKNLESLRLSFTSLSGAVPLFFPQLIKLTCLDLSFNKLLGVIPPQLAALPNLKALHLEQNQLTGEIPDIFGNFAGSPDIYLSHNQLTGFVPTTFAKSDPIRIDFSWNRLEGDISFFFAATKRMEMADFSQNVINFNFSRVQEFPPSLTYLDLNHNNISGSLSSGLAKLDLQTFNVSQNKLCGKIPTGGKLQTFDSSVYLHNTCLCGAPLEECMQNVP